MAPISDSQASETILSSIDSIFFFELPTKINFFKLIEFATSKHFFLLTKEANFLSREPSLSFGYFS